MKWDTRMHRYEFISQSFCSQLFRPNGFKYKIQYYLSRNACNFFCFNSSLSAERTACCFYISHYSVTENNPLHDGSVAENTTEQVNWYFSSAVVSSWKGWTFIIHVYFPRYSVETSWKRLIIYVCWTRYSVEIIVEDINIRVVYTIY